MFDVITADKETQELLRMREKGERDFNSAMKHSRIEGRKEEKRETALSMLKDDVPMSAISKYTGLSTTEIKALKSH
jgi:predicted transposase YdaD